MSETFSDKLWRRIYALGVLVLFSLVLFASKLVPFRFNDLFATYGIVMIFFLLGLYLPRNIFQAQAEIKLFFIWLLWTLFTRLINGDYYLYYEFSLLTDICLGFLLLTLGTTLDKRERSLLLDVVSFLYAGFFTLIALLGIFVFITNSYIHIPPEEAWFTIIYDGTIFFPNYLSSSRMQAAPRLLLALGLLLCQFVKRRNIFTRILCGVSMLTVYVALALCHVRTAQIAMSIAGAMLAILVVLHFSKKHKKHVRFILSCVFAAAALLVCYKGCDMASALVSSAHSAAAPAFEQYYNQLENKPDPEYFGLGKSAQELLSPQSASDGEADTASPAAEAEPAQISAHDSRSIIGNWSFTERLEIWVSGIVALSRDIKIALVGQLQARIAPVTNAVINELFPYIVQYKINMHNAYLEVLMLTGIPGFILIFAFVVLTVKKMVKVFFSHSEKLSFLLKLMTLPISAFFVECLAECFLFSHLDLSTMAFYLLTGLFLGEYYEIFPAERKGILPAKLSGRLFDNKQ